jgi:flavin reductase (DIM6/NTAB) family NADH-FMN oxidoreductase RutF
MAHEEIDPSTLSARETYQLMTDLVAPRPIAWVSTIAADGTRNLAPFSYFQAVCSAPPMVVLACSWRSDGTPKDTLRNILDTREFVVNHVGRQHAAPMNATSADLAPDVDEWATLHAAGFDDVSAVASSRVAPPRIGQVAAALECRLVHAIPLGHGRAGAPSSTLVVGEVIAFQLATPLVRRDDQGRLAPIDAARLDAVGRLGGIAYTDTHGRFDLPRPRHGSPA